MAELKKDLLVFNVDFNELDSAEGRYVIASRRAGRVSSFRVPEAYEHVWLENDEGDGCPGIVHLVRERTILVEPAWGHWVAAPNVGVSKLPEYTRADCQDLVYG